MWEKIIMLSHKDKNRIKTVNKKHNTRADQVFRTFLTTYPAPKADMPYKIISHPYDSSNHKQTRKAITNPMA